MKRVKRIFFFVFFALNFKAWGADSSLPISAAIDLFYQSSSLSSESSQISPRGIEVMLSSPLDPVFDAKINIAGHEESGVFRYELHEATLSSTKFAEGFQFRLGRFFLGVGRLNQIHRHDWPFPSAPQVQERFFAAEGASDDGFEMSHLWPDERATTWVMGVTDSYTYGHAHEAGKRPPHPLVYTRVTQFFDGQQGGLLMGGNLLYRTSFEKEKTLLAGLDLTYKRRTGPLLTYLLQSEIWFRDRQYPTVDRVRETGAYLFSQWALNENWKAGLRFDAFLNHSLRFSTTQEIRKDLDYAIVPVLTYQTSEFVQWRASAGRYVDTTQGDSDLEETRAEFQLIMIMGAHPAHQF